jgi:MFS family permease
MTRHLDRSVVFVLAFGIKSAIYAVLSHLALWLAAKGMDGTAIGGTILFYTFTARAFPVVFGYVFQLIDGRHALAVGLGALILANTGYAFVPAGYPFAAMALLGGLGIGLVEPVLQGMTARLDAGVEARQANFGRYSLAVNAGAAVGPVAAAWLFRTEPRLVFALASAVLVTCLVAVSALTSQRLAATRESFGAYFRRTCDGVMQPSVIPFHALNIGFWVLYAQMYVLMPIYVTQHFHAATAVGPLFATNALTVIVLQLPLGRLASGWRPPVRLTAGFTAVIGSLFLMGIAPSMAYAYAAMVLFTVGEVLFMPAIMAQFAAEADRRSILPASFLATCIGISAIGDGLGSLSGTWLFAQFGSRCVWIAHALFGLGVIVIYSAWQRWSTMALLGGSLTTESVSVAEGRTVS